MHMCSAKSKWIGNCEFITRYVSIIISYQFVRCVCAFAGTGNGSSWLALCWCWNVKISKILQIWRKESVWTIRWDWVRGIDSQLKFWRGFGEENWPVRNYQYPFFVLFEVKRTIKYKLFLFSRINKESLEMVNNSNKDEVIKLLDHLSVHIYLLRFE